MRTAPTRSLPSPTTDRILHRSPTVPPIRQTHRICGTPFRCILCFLFLYCFFILLFSQSRVPWPPPHTPGRSCPHALSLLPTPGSCPHARSFYPHLAAAHTPAPSTHARKLSTRPLLLPTSGSWPLSRGRLPPPGSRPLPAAPEGHRKIFRHRTHGGKPLP